MKKSWICFAVLIVVIIGGIFTFKAVTHYDEKINSAEKFKKEYESLNGKTNEKNGKEYRTVSIDKENPFYYISAEDLAKKIENKETFAVYFGFKSCPWCRSIIEDLVLTSKNLGIARIYYVDVLDIRDTISIDENGELKTTKEGSEGYKKLLTQLDSVLSDYTLTKESGEKVSTGEKRIYAPNIITVVKGEAKGLETGISDSQTDAYQEITDEMHEETKTKFKNVLSLLLEDEGSSCEEDTPC